ncbi:MAG: hypothetical protein KAR39_04475 [Thermoplasmata archaeon]|nr:hypothetical protein [Thermoplasmata archaeon]
MKVRTCSKCGQQFSPQGIRLHEKACDGSKREEVDTNTSPVYAPVDISPQETTDNTHEPPKEEEQAETKVESNVSPEGQGGADDLPIKQADYVGEERGICPYCGREFGQWTIHAHRLLINEKHSNLCRCPECENDFSLPNELVIPELFQLVGELKEEIKALEREKGEEARKVVKEGQAKSEKARLKQAEEVRTEFSKEIESLKEKVKDEIPKEIDDRIEKALGKLGGEIQEKLDQQKQETIQEVDKQINIEKGLDVRLKPLEKMSRCRHVWEEGMVNGQYYLFCKRCGQEQEGKLFELSEVREGDIKFTVFMDDVHPLTVSAKARTILDALGQMGYPRDTEPDILDNNLGVESEHLIHKIHKLDSIVIKALPDNPFVESNPDWWDMKEDERILKEEFLGEFLGTANLGKVVGLGERVAGQPCLIGILRP